MIYVFPSMKKLVELHNKEREKHKHWSRYFLISLTGLEHFNENAALMNYAQEWALNMSDMGRMKHSDMDSIMKLGFSRVGENIACGQKDEASVMKTWLNSPGHRANIMSKIYTDIGCGFAFGADSAIYWCVCFGTPKTN